MRRALVPAMIVLAVNIVITQVTRPIGPFKHDGSDDDIRNIALNFAVALIFQVILLVFMIGITRLVYVRKNTSNGVPESVILGPALAALYVAVAACAILLAIRPPNFVVLTFLGLVVIALTWLCLIVAIARNLRAG